MGLSSFCSKYCHCCKRSKKKNLNPLELKVSSATSLTLFTGTHSDPNLVDPENFQMSLEEIIAHSKDLRNIYAYSLEAMKNFLGKPCYPYITQPKQLYPYIMFLCEGLENNECESIKAVISEKQLSNLQLSVVIKDANLIHPKITDFSRIFCKLWITNENEIFTTVKDGTSYLLWDETFFLDIINYESDELHVEVWSSRPGFLEKLASYSFDSFRDDDPLAEEKGMYFIGEAFEYVKFFPCVGQNMVWTLKKGPRGVQTTGQLNIYIQLATKKAPDFLLHLYCHMAFIRLCYEKQVTANEGSQSLWRNWLEILPNAALTLIQQHALQHGITETDQYFCSWLVVFSLKTRHEDRISFYLLKDLLEYLIVHIDEVDIEQMKDLLSRSIFDFTMFSLDMLRNLHANFNIQNIVMADELFYMLRGLSTADIKISSNYMDSYRVIEDEAFSWYVQVVKDFRKSLEGDDSVEGLSEGLKNIMKIYLRNQIVLDDIFLRAWNVRYSCMTYKKLDEIMGNTIQPVINHLIILVGDIDRKRKTSESLKLLQLYHNVRNLVHYIVQCIPAQSIGLRMNEYSDWFGEELALEWFLLCDLYTNTFIQRAVMADNMERMSPKIVHGTSVPDVTSIIDELVVDVWMKLESKDKFYTHGALTEAIKSCIVYYCENTLTRIKIEAYFSHLKEFQVSDKLCVALSNVYALSEHLHKISRKIKSELKATESSLGFKASQPLISIQSEVQIIAAKVFLLVFKKIKEEIKRLIKNSIKNKTDFINRGSVALCTYVDDTLEVMYSNLKHEAFYIFLRQMWIILLKSLLKELNSKQEEINHSTGCPKYIQRKYSLPHTTAAGEVSCLQTKKQKANIHMIILQTLNQMKTIFFCDGHGLSQYEMDNKLCQELHFDLENKLKKK